jgi:hypothetical protein
MDRRTTLAALPGLLAAALFTAGCGDAVSPMPHGLHGPELATGSATGITLDQWNGALGVGTPYGSGTHIGKGFDPTNPHHGDAIVATFFWVGSTNVITTVTDHLSDVAQTPVGNTYTLVDYVTSGGISMATYVATNVQGFPDPITGPGQVLAVHALTSVPVRDGGVQLTAYSGVGAVTARALGAHLSAAGAGSSSTIADPGAIAVGAGALAHAVSMTNGLVGFAPPAGFTDIVAQSDSLMVADGEYTVVANAGSVDPQWTWYFNAPSTWLATVLTLNPAMTHLAFTVQPRTTLPMQTIPPVQVTAVDDQGNTLASFTGPVTIAIGRNGGLVMQGTLSGTKTVTMVNGVATFSDLSIDQPGNGYTLQVTAAGATGAESAAFDIGAF